MMTKTLTTSKGSLGPAMTQWLKAAAGAAAFFTAFTCSAQHILSVNTPVSATFTSASPQVLTIVTKPGNVIEGMINGRGVILDVQDASGRHLRRLSDGLTASQRFIFVAANARVQHLALTTQSTDAVPYELVVTAVHDTLPVPANNKQETTNDIPSPQLRQLAKHVRAGGNTDAFWKTIAQTGAPLIEPVNERESLVTFLWRGAKHNVTLFGSPSGNHDPLQRLDNTDVWWVSHRLSNAARLSYQFAPDVPTIVGDKRQQRGMISATAQRDPLNPRTYPTNTFDVFEGDSVLELSSAPQQSWIARRDGVATGTLTHHVLSSTLLGNTRDVWLYLPANAKPEALLVTFDGAKYTQLVPTPTILDNLMADGKIPPTAAVFVDNVNRQSRGIELPPNPVFADFLAQEMIPWVRQQGVQVPADKTVVAGSSYGGLASAYVARVHPDVFGNVLSLSGSFWWSPSGKTPAWLTRQYAAMPVAPIKFYLDAGRYESFYNGIEGILETNRTLGHVLRAKGYQVTQRENESGHDYYHWQGSIACGLVALLGQGIDTLPQCNGIVSAIPDTTVFIRQPQ